MQKTELEGRFEQAKGNCTSGGLYKLRGQLNKNDRLLKFVQSTVGIESDKSARREVQRTVRDRSARSASKAASVMIDLSGLEVLVPCGPVPARVGKGTL